MYFYEILQGIMNDRDMSIPDVARATGLSDSTIRSIITRKSKGVALEVAAKISNGLNVDLVELNGDILKENENKESVVFADSLRKYMADKGLRAIDLSKSTGLSEGVISEYLSGKKQPMGKTCFKLANALDITVDELLDSPFAESEKQKREQENVVVTGRPYGDNIKKYRTKKSLTQAELGKMIGKAPSVIGNWEAQTNRPDVDSIEKMLAIFDIDANTFFGWDEHHSKSFGIDAETGEFIPQLEDSDVASILKDVMELPEEALDEIKYFVDLIKIKYRRG